MKIKTIVAERLSELKLFSPEASNAQEEAEEFALQWRELGREILQERLQKQLEKVEKGYKGSRQRRSKRYQTPLGTIELTRRVYERADDDGAGDCLGEKELGLPANGWFSGVEELSSALGVGSEFANANRLLQRWSGVKVSEKTLANHVEAAGEELAQVEAAQETKAVCPVMSSVSEAAALKPERSVFYIGADGIHTPMREGGTREAKVGVMFWQDDHLRLSKTRSMVKQRDYVATLGGVEAFREQLNRCYSQSVCDRPHQVVFLADGAPWIWLMAAVLFPGCIEILDFFHVSEYLWQVARHAFKAEEQSQQDWVEHQQDLLKQSQWPMVIKAAQCLPPGSPELKEAVERLTSYLTNNQTRIDYQSYLQQGLMIGSGVVESSNRRIVTVRLKQSGMFWSKAGAEAVMTLRASYLSGSDRWQAFWNSRTNSS